MKGTLKYNIQPSVRWKYRQFPKFLYGMHTLENGLCPA